MAGRGRLSSLDLVPEEGQEDIQWAMEQLNERKRTASDILFELNDRLTAKGLEQFTISKSAFNRRSLRVAAMNARYAERTAIVKAMAPSMTPEAIEEMDRVVGEILKMAVLEVLDQVGGDLTPKGAMELARGYQSVIQGQAKSAEAREKREKQFAEKVAKGVDAVAKAKGLTTETADELKAKILGIEKKAA
ncbi:MAG TPA: phage protein Gp27 family protein [Methylocystis sp.]|jgi:hypothetical protein